METTPQQQSIVTASATPRYRFLERFAEGLVLILLIALSIAAILLLRPQPAPWVAQVDDPAMASDLQLRGFYGWEQNTDFAYRWSRSTAEVVLPLRYQTMRSYLAEFRLRRAEPAFPQALTLSVNDREFGTMATDTSFRSYRVLLPLGAEGDAYLRLGLATEPLVQAGNPRDLGFLFSQIVIQPLNLREPWPILISLLGLVLIWPILRYGMPAWAAILPLALIALLLPVYYFIMKPTPLSFSWLAGIALVGCAIVGWMTRLLSARIGLVAILFCACFSSAVWGAWFTDDALISFRYAANLVNGNGLVFNPGERVEGFTNFLWTIFAALCIGLGGDVLFWSYLAGVTISLAIIIITYHYGSVLLGSAWGLLAALVVGTSQSLLLYTARGAGMETGFFTLLVLVASGLFLSRFQRSEAQQRPEQTLLFNLTRQRQSVMGFLFALATLTRPEGVLFFSLTVGYLVLYDFSPAWKFAHILRVVRHRLLANIPLIGAYLLIMLPFFFWRFSYYGDLLPNTFYAKTGGGLRAVGRGLAYIGESSLLFGLPLLLAAWIGLLLPTKSARHWVRYLIALMVPYLLYVASVGGDHFPGERFFVPIIPWLALLSAAGCAYLYEATRQPLWRAVLAVFLIGLLGWHVTAALQRGPLYEERVAGSDESVWLWRDLGVWLHESTPPDTSIAAMGIGAIAFYSERTTIDMLGLTDRHIARVSVVGETLEAAGHEKRDPEYILNVRRPTFIPQIWEDYFGGAPVLEQQYQLTTIRTPQGRIWRLWQRREP